MTVPHGLLFALLCFVWGTSWLAVKVGVAEAPAFVFTTVRSLASGLLMLALVDARAAVALLRRAPARMVAVAFLTNTVTYSGLYWGTGQAPSGLAAIVNNALMPIGLLAFGLAFHEERFTWRGLAGIVLGAAGLVLLFASRSGGDYGPRVAAGLAAVAVATLAYCLGSIWSRPLVRDAPPMVVGALQMLIGGSLLAPVAWFLDRPDAAALAALGKPAALAGMAWLVVGGGVVGMTIYLRLLRDWGPTRTGMYAFVAPIIAVATGAVALGERLGWLEAVGAALMLTAAALVLPSRRPSAAAGRRDRPG
jgi:drug/metabolite transporter (DMT)-like permease